jgi:hypothetical protein
MNMVERKGKSSGRTLEDLLEDLVEVSDEDEKN